MGMRYCQHCKRAFSTGGTLSHQGQYFCLICKKPTEDMGEEDSELSIEGKLSTEQGLTQAEVVRTATGKTSTYRLQEIDTIILECEDTLSKDPENPEALFTLAKLWYAKGDVEMGRVYAERTLDSDDSHQEARAFLAHYYGDATDAFEVQTEDVEELYRLAHIHVDKDEWDQAKVLLTRIIGLQSHHLGARRYLAELAMTRETYAEAVSHLTILRLKRPEDPFILYNLGIACHHSGNDKRALACFNDAYEHCRDAFLIKNDTLKKLLRVFIERLDK